MNYFRIYSLIFYLLYASQLFAEEFSPILNYNRDPTMSWVRCSVSFHCDSQRCCKLALISFLKDCASRTIKSSFDRTNAKCKGSDYYRESDLKSDILLYIFFKDCISTANVPKPLIGNVESYVLNMNKNVLNVKTIYDKFICPNSEVNKFKKIRCKVQI
ncbi:hypothetical protein BY996DRAFT_7118705, partial [Phakopsora pachyrhizi]